MNALANIFQDNKFLPSTIGSFEEKLFFENERRRPYLVKFFVLLFLSIIIASYGVISDSTATVIGAMIIAPLMTPIMAAAAAIVMGNPERTLHALGLVAAGVATVILVSFMIGLTHRGIISSAENAQIAGRISPSLADLMVALASGAAGAFAFSRDDIADSLPGVAIAISLVPPLCVVGIMLSQSELEAARGALLLFTTNFLSILFAGGAVLALLNLAGAATVNLKGHNRRNAFIMIGIGIALVSIPLALTSVRTTRTSAAQYATQTAAQEWVEGSDYEVRSVRVMDKGMVVTIAGSGDIPPIEELEEKITERIDNPGPTKVEIFENNHTFLEFR